MLQEGGAEEQLGGVVAQAVEERGAGDLLRAEGSEGGSPGGEGLLGGSKEPGEVLGARHGVVVPQERPERPGVLGEGALMRGSEVRGRLLDVARIVERRRQVGARGDVGEDMEDEICPGSRLHGPGSSARKEGETGKKW
jgi:hypothetical protein